MPSKTKLFTIGHSTHSLEKFLSLLAQHRIDALADIRRLPGSRKFPQFNQDDLASALQQAGIKYHWLESWAVAVARSETARLRRISACTMQAFATTPITC